ncbi:fused DSP-PTPase phosphatase/NAD kinase-like protein [Edaphocola flava]|uniref:fused DSP-PTPase phosphatase/NAD kinase-like protein n=1 Tax=Edaphocola flava TaxID=2499629 RepID=UPI00100B5533|nr:dual specificity protein phosphatase family protein [Edaphocola flava]
MRHSLYTSLYRWMLPALLMLGLSQSLRAQDTILPIKNIHQVSAQLYRSGQPHRKGFKALETAGFTDVINLRTIWSDRCCSGKAKINLHHIKVVTASMTEEDLVVIFRQIEQSEGKVLVHCWHGSDRTGTVVAMYRILYQGWDKEKAISEMMYGGYGFHKIFGNLPRLIRSIDIEKFRLAINQH